MMKRDALSMQHYFYVGRSNLLTVLNVLSVRSTYRGGDAPIRDILDFGCGHGRVTRWFVAAFPKAQIHITDYQKTAVEFCVANFGCRATDNEIPAARFDLVWLGSVFTHLPSQIVEPLLETTARLASTQCSPGIHLTGTVLHRAYERFRLGK
jgi:hypothetical protein